MSTDKYRYKTKPTYTKKTLIWNKYVWVKS